MSGDLARVIDAGGVLTALRGPDGVPGPPDSLTLDRAWPWRGDGLCALFVAARGGRRAQPWMVLRPPARGLPRRLRQAVERGVLRPLPGIGALAMPRAADPEIPVGELLDGVLAAARLRRWLPAGATARGLEARTLSYKPLRRLTVSYRPVGTAQEVRLYGKALRAGELDGVEQSCRALARTPAAGALALPCGVSRRWNLLLSEPRPGTPLERLVPGPAAERGVAVAGEALAALHGSGAALPASHPRAAELAVLDRWLGVTGRACPEMAARLGAARARLAEAGRETAPAQLLPGHRDYHPGQLLVAPRGATILDLDTAAATEPELDAGNFLAHLELFELDRRGVSAAPLGAAFRRAYERRARRRLSSRRLAWYQAGALLRLACVYRFRLRGAVLGSLLTRRCLKLLEAGATSWEVI